MSGRGSASKTILIRTSACVYKKDATRWFDFIMDQVALRGARAHSPKTAKFWQGGGWKDRDIHSCFYEKTTHI